MNVRLSEEDREEIRKRLNKLAWRIASITGVSFRDVNHLLHEILDITV